MSKPHKKNGNGEAVKHQVSFPPRLARFIDDERGTTSRSKWLRDLIAKAHNRPDLAESRPPGRPK